MNLKKGLLWSILGVTLFISCAKSGETDLVEIDLMAHGMPILIKAPENPEIKKVDYLLTNDMTVRKGDDYYLQIFESDATTLDEQSIKSGLLGEVKSNPYFKEIVEEELNGFIYKIQLDSIHSNYGFRYVRVQGDKEYIFQTGLIGTFSLEQVQRMYNSVKR